MAREATPSRKPIAAATPPSACSGLVEVARQRGVAVDFRSVTWPGFDGLLTAVAPGRFAASINQAPMRRRTRVRWLLWLDYALGNAARRERLHARHRRNVRRHRPTACLGMGSARQRRDAGDRRDGGRGTFRRDRLLVEWR